MVIEIKQSNWFQKCHKCPNMIQVGDLFLHTASMHGSWSYCRECGLGKYGYGHEDFRTFRPETEIINYDLNVPNMLNRWDGQNNMLINLEQLR